MIEKLRKYPYLFVEFEEASTVGSLLNLKNQIKILTPDNQLFSMDIDSPQVKLFSKVGVVGYDLKPLCKILKKNANVVPKAVFDTKLAKKLLHIQDTKDQLLELSKRFLSLRQLLNSKPLNIKASGVSKKIFDLINPVAAIEFNLVPNLAQIELSGLPIDETKTKEMLSKYAALYQKLYLDFKSRYLIDPQSPTQLKHLFSKLGIKTGTEGSLKESSLKIYQHLEPVSHLLKLREIKKVLNKLEELNRFLKDGRVYPTFIQIASPTGRMAAVEPNVQNLPSKLKTLVKAPQGKTLIIADYSQIELRILAEYVKEPKMIEAFNKNLDLHRYTASLILKKNYTEISDRERALAKAINFGLVYGMSPASLQKYVYTNYQIDVSPEEINQFYNRFFSVFSKVHQWQEEIKERLKTEGKLEVSSILGRSNRVSRFTDAVNYPIQATGSDLLKLAVNLFYTKKRDLKADIVNLIHDEIVLEVDVEDVETAKTLLREAMEEAGKYILKQVPISFDIRISKVWEK